MSKRAAEVQLTQDNLDEQYDASEHPGQFDVASEDQLKQRVIKVAKRGRVPNEGASSGGIFAGLNTSQPFSLGSTIPPTTVAVDVKPPGSPVSRSYLSQLKSLNESVSEWITKHVRTNPFVDLSPIFSDYATHLVTIERKYKDSSEQVDDHHDVIQESESREKETDTEVTTDGQTTDEPGSPPSISESQEESIVQGKETTTTSESGEDDCNLLTMRAKLYYNKGSEYIELGVGTLKVQSLSDNTVCLLLRNNTSLGNVLLNIRVTGEIPVTSKANNVIVISSPNPPLGKDADNTPVSYLIRVKTSQLAEKLLTTLKENTTS